MAYTKWINISTYKTKKRAEAMAQKVEGSAVFLVKSKSKTRYQVRRLSRQGAKR